MLMQGHGGVPPTGAPVTLTVPSGVVLTDVVLTLRYEPGTMNLTVSDSSGPYIDTGAINHVSFHFQSGILSDGTLTVSGTCYQNAGALMWTGYQP